MQQEAILNTGLLRLILTFMTFLNQMQCIASIILIKLHPVFLSLNDTQIAIDLLNQLINQLLDAYFLDFNFIAQTPLIYKIITTH